MGQETEYSCKMYLKKGTLLNDPGFKTSKVIRCSIKDLE